MKRYHPYLLVFLACGGAIAIFLLLPQPFLWTLLLWTVVGIMAALLVRTGWITVTLVNAVAVVLVLAVYEGYLWLRVVQGDPTRFDGSYTTDYFVGDDLLGYGPAKSQAAVAEKYHGDELIYRVTYTIGADGLRVAPPADQAESGCVPFSAGL